MEKGFAFVDERVPGIRWDAKYATWDNFTGKPVDGYGVNRIVGAVELCEALARCREKAARRGFGLLIWDGYRPQRAVDSFLRWSALPEDGRTKSRHYPRLARSEMVAKGYVAEKSSHSRGGAVDLTLFSLETGALLPMGGWFDLMDPRSHHGAEGLSKAEDENRKVLRDLMEEGGFDAYPWEWWHYTLREEPYPDTYFDFPVA